MQDSILKLRTKQNYHTKRVNNFTDLLSFGKRILVGASDSKEYQYNNRSSTRHGGLFSFKSTLTS